MVKSNKVVYFDVDETLVCFNYPKEYEYLTIELEQFGIKKRALPHFAHIEKLKEHALRGHEIRIESGGGWEWAEYVVKKLNLEQYIDMNLVRCKAVWGWDDESPEKWCRIFWLDPIKKENK